MNQIVTTGIVLTRRDFNEADRILTVLTPDYGKVGLLAKGVRRSTSKLAGGIELFSVSHLTYIVGRGQLSTLVSSRLITHYANIVKDINRTMLGYDLIKMFNRAIEDAAGEEYFELLRQVFIGLDKLALDPQFIQMWFYLQLLKMAGHQPSLGANSAGQPLDPSAGYLFDYDQMAFRVAAAGKYTVRHIKFLRLGLAAAAPGVLGRVNEAGELLPDCLPLAKTMLTTHIRV